jgi:hypothetical protein
VLRADTADEDVRVLTRRLAEECTKAGLDAHVLADTRVRVSAPGAHERLAEVIRCMPDDQERLAWWWSWDELICPVTRTSEAVRAIARVVTPPPDAAHSRG